MSRMLVATLVMVVLVAPTALAADDARVAEAAKSRDRQAVEALIQQGSDVNVPEADGTTALHWAVMFGDASMVTELLEAGANASARNR